MNWGSATAVASAALADDADGAGGDGGDDDPPTTSAGFDSAGRGFGGGTVKIMPSSSLWRKIKRTTTAM